MLRQDMVAAAVAAAGRLRLAPFEWVLHEAASFQGRQPPCILRSSSAPEPLQRLWQDLRRTLVLAGQGRHVARNFTPHVTVAYSYGVQLDITPIEPVTWLVGRLALVHSVAGQPDYDVLAEWPL
jgi:2'-5' RNA ligase